MIYALLVVYLLLGKERILVMVMRGDICRVEFGNSIYSLSFFPNIYSNMLGFFYIAMLLS